MGSEHQCLSYCHSLHENIALHYIIGEITKILWSVWDAICVEITFKSFWWNSAGEYIEKSCFTCSGCTHYGSHLSCLKDTRYVFEEIFLNVFFIAKTWGLSFIFNFYRVYDIFEGDIDFLIFEVIFSWIILSLTYGLLSLHFNLIQII